MQYCKRCKVTLYNPQEKCPLCQGRLDGEAEESRQLFPDLKEQTSQLAMLFRVFSFFCIATVVVSIAINFLTGFQVFWAGYVLAGTACMWVVTAVAIQKRRNLLKNAAWQMLLVCAALLLWDWGTGWKSWSVDFGLPAAILATMLFICIYAKAVKAPVSYYLSFLVLTAVTGLLPAVLLMCRAIRFVYPSVICSAISVLVLAALVIFRGRILSEELKKKAHL